METSTGWTVISIDRYDYLVISIVDYLIKSSFREFVDKYFKCYFIIFKDGEFYGIGNNVNSIIELISESFLVRNSQILIIIPKYDRISSLVDINRITPDSFDSLIKDKIISNPKFFCNVYLGLTFGLFNGNKSLELYLIDIINMILESDPESFFNIKSELVYGCSN